MSRKKKVKQELNMADHTARLRAIPVDSWYYAKRWMVLLTAGAILTALAWLALGR